jgi:hypothetical protein
MLVRRVGGPCGMWGELEAKKPLARTGRRCGDNIKVDLERIELEDVVWLNVACNMNKLWAFVSGMI